MNAKIARAAWVVLWSLLAVGSMALAGCCCCGC